MQDAYTETMSYVGIQLVDGEPAAALVMVETQDVALMLTHLRGIIELLERKETLH